MLAADRGKVYTWGSGSHGRLGHGDAKPQLTPKIIDHLTKMNVTAVKVIAGYDHMLLLSDKGEIWAWGAGSNGETAQNTTVRRLVPHPVLFATENHASSPDLSNGHTTDLTNSNEDGKQENGVSKNGQKSENGNPQPGPFVDIASGLNFSIAIAQDGSCYSWGNARNGVLGNGETEGIVRVATKIQTNVSFTKVFASKDHVIAFGSGEGAPIVQTPEPAVEAETANTDNGATPPSSS